MEDFFYIHTISYYSNNNRDTNIESVFNKLDTSILSKDQTKTDKNLLIVYVIYDDELTDKLKERYEKYKHLETDKTKILILYRWNTGGTVQTLNYTYNYLINTNITCKYIGVWEDDVIFKDEYFFDIVKKHLNMGYIYVGSLWTEDRPDINYDNNTKQFKLEYHNRRPKNQICPWIKNKHIFIDNSNDELVDDKHIKWCEDPYITTMSNLKIIKDKLIKFTLCPETKKYTHIETGINYGEVGFPTRLHINGFKYIGLKRDEYYQFLNQNSIGDKYE